MRTQKGFTLVELMITMAVLGIIASIAVPSMAQFFDKRRVIEAAEAVYSQIQYARSEAVARSTTVAAVIDTGTWAIGVSDNTGCDPAITDSTNADACTLEVSGTDVLKRIVGSDYPTVDFDSNTNAVSFDPLRGTAGGIGTLTIDNDDYELRVIISAVGRVTMCSPAASFVPGYKEC